MTNKTLEDLKAFAKIRAIACETDSAIYFGGAPGLYKFGPTPKTAEEIQKLVYVANQELN